MMQAKYKIGGMTCGGCVSSVKKALSRALPKAVIEVSLDEESASIDGEHAVETIRTAIENAGFDFGGMI